jgi:uncharacterized protein involved in exopolysaccharide biosynthesis
MSIASFIAGLARAAALAAAAGVAAFGLLVLFHPFGPQGVAPALTNGDMAALHTRIDAARIALQATETALAAQPPAAVSALPDAQLPAQIAAVTDRRDVAARDAEAIRAALKARADVSSLAEIRDSAVIGQLLAQQADLDSQLAEQGAKLKANHPTMRALAAQKSALASQVEAQAAAIASALEAEARLDDAQLKTLQPRLAVLPASPTNTAALTAEATAQRAELDGLIDSYFGAPPVAAPVGAKPDWLNPLNLLVAAIACVATLVGQLLLAIRRRRLARQADLARWRADADPEIPAEPVPVSEPDFALRRAS